MNWIQIPCAPKYEMNQRGDVRNIETGQLIKPWTPTARKNDKRFGLYIDGIRKTFSQPTLLRLTHGNPIQSRLSVIVSHGGERYYFDSCRQAAKFLAERESYTTSAVVYHLSKRREEVYGWRIKYLR